MDESLVELTERAGEARSAKQGYPHDAGAKEILRGETWVLNPYSCSRCWEG